MPRWDAQGNLIPEGTQRWDAQGNPVVGSPAPPPGLFSKLASVPGDILLGLGSGVMKTGLGTSKLIGAVPKETTLEDIGMAPEGTIQKLAMGGEQIAEFFAPGEQIAKAGQLVKGGKLLKGAAEVGLEALSAGGVTAAQTGSKEEALKGAAIAGGFTAGGKLISAGAKKLAAQILESRFKAPLRNYEGGFKPENVFKYELGGTLSQTATKTATAIKERANDLATRLTGNPAQVDILDALAKTENELIGTTAAKSKAVGGISDIRAALNRWVNEVSEVSPSGVTDLLNATNIKRRVGLDGAWKYGVRDRTAIADEKVANSFYTHLKNAIETSSQDPEIRKINQELSELIPIEAAAIRRLPIEKRQDVIGLVTTITSLPSMLGAGPGALALPAGYWISKSPYMANVIQKAAKAGTVGTTGRVAAGISSQMQTPAPPPALQ